MPDSDPDFAYRAEALGGECPLGYCEGVCRHTQEEVDAWSGSYILPPDEPCGLVHDHSITITCRPACPRWPHKNDREDDRG